MNYDSFVDSKRIEVAASGFDVGDLNPMLFPFQSDVVRWAIRRGKAALFQDCGLGKSIQEWEFAKHVSLKTDMPVLILAPLSVNKQMVVTAPGFGYTINNARSQVDIDSGINITNYEMLHKFDPSKFGGLICDECFAKGTKIDVVHDDYRITQTPIEDVRVGDQILNASGIDIVSDVHARKVEYAIRVNVDGGSVVCSPNHPWFTQRGWRSAQDLEPTDKILATTEAMRMVWEEFYSKAPGRSEGQTVLRSILFSEMANEPAGTFSESAYTGNSSEARKEKKRMVAVGESESNGRNRTSKGLESNGEPRNKEESFIHIESDEARTFRAWGQRTWFDSASEDFDGCVGRELDSGICFVVGEKDTRLSNMLQGRLGESRAKSCYRSGWSLTPQQESARRKEGSKTSFAWVEGIEVLEQGNPELERFRSEDGNIYFYDLGATRHPSFSINGLLVHNSSILKGGALGKMSNDLVAFAKDIPYRLAATATPAPNDLEELIFHAQFLGIMREAEIKALFFTQDGNSSNKFRLKRNAVEKFYEWMASWAVAMRRPSDLGYADDGFNLPPLNIEQITVDISDPFANGTLFGMEATGIAEQRTARKATITDRVKIVADMVNASNEQWIVWCDLNDESAALSKAIPDAIEVKGSDSADHKEDGMLGFAAGKYRVIVSKCSIAGFGMNWQQSHNMVFCGLGNSYEQYYQGIRRQWRFGQTQSVNVYVVVSTADGAVVTNIRRKEQQASEMFDNLVKHMSVHTNLGQQTRNEMEYNPQQTVTVPAWMRKPKTAKTEPGRPWIDLNDIPYQWSEAPSFQCGAMVGNQTAITPEWIKGVI